MALWKKSKESINSMIRGQEDDDDEDGTGSLNTTVECVAEDVNETLLRFKFIIEASSRRRRSSRVRERLSVTGSVM